MTDEKRPPGELGDIDWDEALSEWEKKAFVPTVAHDVLTNKPGSPPAAGPSRPLYRPPVAPQSPPRPRPPAIPAAPPRPAPAVRDDGNGDDEEQGRETRIAEVPRDLLRSGEGAHKSPSRTGLKQLFARDGSAPRLTTADESFAEESEEAATSPKSPVVPAARAPTPAPVGDGVAPAIVAEGSTVPAARVRGWPHEQPASIWLDDGDRAAFEARARWIEAEGRALGPADSARALLVCSEIWAMVGNTERARALAAEARDVAPSNMLSHRQARAPSLGGDAVGSDGWLDAIEVEANLTPPGPARVHSILLSAQALDASGDHESAAKRYDQAARMSVTDARAPVAIAAHALASGDANAAAAGLPDGPLLASLANAIAIAFRLRGRNDEHTSPESPPAADASLSEVLLRARQALDKRDVTRAAQLVARLASVPELAKGANWLAAMLSAAGPGRQSDTARWLRDLVDSGDPDAHRALLACAIGTDDRDEIEKAVAGGSSLTSAERVTLGGLAGLPLSPTDPHLDATANAPGMEALAAAGSARTTPDQSSDRSAQIRARAERTTGSPQSKATVKLGRLLSAAAPAAEIEAALHALTELAGVRSPAQQALKIELAMRAGRSRDVSAALDVWGADQSSPTERAARALAAALVAERANDRERALRAFETARAADPTNEAAVRAIGSLEAVDLVADLSSLADALGEGPAAAAARIEAAIRGADTLPEPALVDLLERADRAAPSIPIAGFLAEQLHRRAGDTDYVLRRLRERREHTQDPIEGALDAVREAMLAAGSNSALATERLLDAHRARPSDVALRELCERMASASASGPMEDGAPWREQNASLLDAGGRALFFLEAALEYERLGDDSASLRAAESAAAASDDSFTRIARERAELRLGNVARLAEELVAVAKNAPDARSRREAYERLAVVDGTGRQDAGSALLWHRAILDEHPDHAPSLRHIEHHLIGEGRDGELEPVAAAIANLLRDTGPGECTAHAELAARLRLRDAAADWESTRDMVDLAASQAEPSLWALRMLMAHAQARGDDATYVSAILRLIDREIRPAEEAVLLVAAAEADLRLGKLDDARSLLVRASAIDPGDVIAWGLLAEAHSRAGDARDAAEAYESLARSSHVREQQVAAWYEAGCIWQDGLEDDERAIAALEAAVAIDVSYRDVFDRLSRIYVDRELRPELAGLLERRIPGLGDPAERLAMEVHRARILLEVGDFDRARNAFEAALAEQPDDAGALTAFADLCVMQHDWEAAEQALIRLARLLPTPEEQRDVYARLGDLYGRHLLNLARAEVALKEVLKRAPDDFETTEKLVEVHRRQNDATRAAELQQDLVARARSTPERVQRLVELSLIHEQTGHDNRRAEQILEAARRELPQDASIVRALFAFYRRHNQTPAITVLLDRAAGDARRALSAGRFAEAHFELLAAVFELRGQRDAVANSIALLAAVDGRAVSLPGAAERAFDPRLDDLLAPEALTPAMRLLLRKTGDALDLASPIDLRSLKAVAAAPDGPMARLATRIGRAIGLGQVQVLVSPKLGASCLPVGSSPPAVVLGEGAGLDEHAAAFLLLRTLKLVQARASALARTPPNELEVLVTAWLKCFNPTWQPQGIPISALNAAGGRLRAVLPRTLDPDVGTIALEAAGSIGTQAALLGPAAIAWADRTALLATGDANAAFHAIAASGGTPGGAPSDPAERRAWLARTPEARDLLVFGVSDAFAEARTRLGLG